MIGSVGWEELLIILLIVGLIAGGSRVAEIGGALGKGVREFREAVQGDDEDDETTPSEDEHEQPEQELEPEEAKARSSDEARSNSES